MKKIYVVLFSFFSLFGFSQQANLFCIPNQSAQFIRMPSREAVVDIDAVFYNPANLPSLGNGFHISINNQILNQSSKVTSDYSLYTEHPKTYEGNVRSFIFPSVYLNWNKNKSSFHGGFLIVGGAGGVNYANLPVSDRGIADVPSTMAYSNFFVAPSLVDYDAQNGTSYSNIVDYRFKFNNKGLGFSPGAQVGFAYKVNKYFSFGFDLRWMQQIINSEGEVTDIQILPETQNASLNQWQTPGDYFRAVGAETNTPVYGSFIASQYDDQGADRYINVRQKGSGFNFIPSILIQPTDKLNIALKYEHKTKVTLITLVRDGKDGGKKFNPETEKVEPIFVDGAETRSDIPGFICGGISYKVTKNWMLNTGGRYMFIKGANYNGREKYIDKNYYEIEFATEYQIIKQLAVSGGYTYNHAGVNKNYHNDVDYWIPGHTFCIGTRVDFTKTLSLDLGGMFTKNVTQSFNYNNHYYADGNQLAGAPTNYDGQLTPSKFGNGDYQTGNYNMKFQKYSFIIGMALNIKIRNNKSTTPNLEEDTEADTPYHFRG